MRKLSLLLVIAILVVISACSKPRSSSSMNSAPTDAPAVREESDSFVLVQGGTFKNTKSNFHGQNITIANFYIGKYEVTQKEWADVMGSNPSTFKGDHLPVEMVNWYDAVEYCNQRSVKEGLQPYYNIAKIKKDPNNMSANDTIKWTVTVNEGANGYRLPTEAEWEYAASGGQMSKSYTYSGSNDVEEVAWYWRNAGDKHLSVQWNWSIIESNHNQTKSFGLKKPNELGLYDMSGNVREWCWDWYTDADTPSGTYRVVKGGGWIGGDNNNEISFRGKFEANGMGPDQGFRVIRGE